MRRPRSFLSILGFSISVSLSSGERAYPQGCSEQPTSYYNYDRYPFPPPDVPTKSTDDFQLVRRLGSGKFSDVFEAVDVEMERRLVPSSRFGVASTVDPRTLVVLKCLKPVSERKIRRELLVLSHASKLPNLARLLGVVVTQAKSPMELQPMPTLVLEHAGLSSQWLRHGKRPGSDQDPYLSEYEIQYYIYHLLVALDALHSQGIMHRDVKPRNVLINRGRQTSTGGTDPAPLMLIDLGLADFYLPNVRYNVRVASRHFKSPELLVGFEQYDYAIDIWGVGCILASLLLRRDPFFQGNDNLDQLGKVIAVLGTSGLISYMTKYQVEQTPEIRKVIAKYVVRGGRKKTWESLVPKGTTPSPQGLDLLDKLLVYDHEERLTAKQAMAHPFFSTVRDRVNAEIRHREIAAIARSQAF